MKKLNKDQKRKKKLIKKLKKKEAWDNRCAMKLIEDARILLNNNEGKEENEE